MSLVLRNLSWVLVLLCACEVGAQTAADRGGQQEGVPAAGLPTSGGVPSAMDAYPASADEGYRKTTVANLAKNLVIDQEGIWTSPSRLRTRDFSWVVPFGALSAGMIAADRHIEKGLPKSSSSISRSNSLSNAGLAAVVGGAGGFYVLGVIIPGHHAKHVKSAHSAHNRSQPCVR